MCGGLIIMHTDSECCIYSEFTVLSAAFIYMYVYMYYILCMLKLMPILVGVFLLW